MKVLPYLILVFLITGCTGGGGKKSPKGLLWKYDGTITLDDINPIGIYKTENHFYLSDGDRNRVIRTDMEGQIANELSSLERPMHLNGDMTTTGMELLIPEYLRDSVVVFNGTSRGHLEVPFELDSPAAASNHDGLTAVADFYNHRILFKNKEDKWSAIGHEGKHELEFYYPTDVQITEKYIIVADAYNNRVQLLDLKGKFLRYIGEKNNINAALGVYGTTDQLFISDFENSRVMIYDYEGTLQQELKEHISKSTDLFVADNKLWVCNYRSGELVVYTLKQ